MRHLVLPGLLAAAASGFARPAYAVPSYSAQTGLACAACHIGAFGPQLTPFGRAFKIGGYTMGGGTGPAAHIPVSAMAFASYTNTDRNQSGPAAPHYASNGNFTLDQVSLFLAGRVSDHVGAFIQGTYDGVGRTTFVDNADVRLTTPTTIAGWATVLGLSVNNSPGISDPYNSTYPFGYPNVSSALALTPNAGTILGGALAGNSLGVNAYAWIDQHVYVDVGLYDTMAPGLMKVFGESYGPGSETGLAPYARAAYEWDWGNNNAHLGAAVFYSRFNPTDGTEDGRSADGSFGHDSYTDLFADGGYQFIGKNNTLAFDAHYVDELRHLGGSAAFINPGVSASATNGDVQDAQATATYYWHQTYGGSLSWDRLSGSHDDLLYNTGQADTGSIRGSPDSNAFTLEADYVPFGHDGSWGAPFANLKLGVQYTIYTQFNGAATNYDGFGRSAADNNTLYVFIWTLF